MASIDKLEIQNLINKLNYIVTISKTENGLCVSYPWAGINTYLIAENGFILCDENNNNYIYYLPDYAIITGIFVQIKLRCFLNNYNIRLASYVYGNKNKKSIFNLVNSRNKNKEKKLIKIFKLGLKYNFSKSVEQKAKQYDVLDGYRELIKIWENQ